MDDADEAGRGAALPAARRGLMGRLLGLARGYYASEERSAAWGLTAAVLGLKFLQIGIQVRFNLWNRDFFNALEMRDGPLFYGQMWLFAALAFASMATAVAQLWARQMLSLRWRTWLVHRLQARLLRGGCHYRMQFLPDAADNPDQRITENTRWATAMTVDLVMGLLQAGLMLATFVGILWTLSGPLLLQMGGAEYEIPGYMVVVAVLYAAFGSLLTWAIGRPMVGINIRRNETEGSHRFALVRLRENAESVALIQGEADEERSLRHFFGRVAGSTRELLRSERHLMWLGSAYMMVAGVLPTLVASPRYFAGAITLGVLMQISQAFLEVTRALFWFVENFPRLADWRSHVERVVALEESLAEADRHGAEGGIEVTEAAPGTPAAEERILLRGLTVASPEGDTIIRTAEAEILPGERVLVTGSSGSGKSTLFRAIAGVWPWGSGGIRTPPRAQMMFMPQRPYLPLGTLRAAVAYPAPLCRFADAELRAAMARCNLRHLLPQLDEVGRWGQVLSLGEQQRLAFARLLLHRPRWIFMDEATAALDEANQDSMMRLFQEELAGSALVSIGHRSGLAAYHDRSLVLVAGPGGARLASEEAAIVPAAEPGWRGLVEPVMG
jgi:putative ATP-binding cassette transporter